MMKKFNADHGQQSVYDPNFFIAVSSVHYQHTSASVLSRNIFRMPYNVASTGVRSFSSGIGVT